MHDGASDAETRGQDTVRGEMRRRLPGEFLYDEIELQKSYVPINKTEPIAADISFDVSSVPTMEYPMGSLTMVIAPLAAEELVPVGTKDHGSHEQSEWHHGARFAV